VVRCGRGVGRALADLGRGVAHAPLPGSPFPTALEEVLRYRELLTEFAPAEPAESTGVAGAISQFGWARNDISLGSGHPKQEPRRVFAQSITNPPWWPYRASTHPGVCSLQECSVRCLQFIRWNRRMNGSVVHARLNSALHCPIG